MARLKVLAIAACVIQLFITVGVPLMQFFLVFNQSIPHMHILLVTGVSALVSAALGLASALTRGPVMPALHVVAAILLAALMGSFSTQTYLDLNNQCNVAQAAVVGCGTCPCAATNSCTEELLKAADCSSCRALATDFCARVRWQVLLLPYTGLIEAVLLAIPGFLSLLLLLQRSNGSMAVADYTGSKGDVKVMVNAWPGQSTSEPEDWPSTNPAASPPAKRVASSKRISLAAEKSWQAGGNQGSDMVTELNPQLYSEHSGYMTNSSLGTTVDSQHELAAAAAAPKKKPSGLKKKLTSKVSAARADASLG